MWYMQRLEHLESVPAFNYLDEWQQQLVRLSFSLWQREKVTGSQFLDYSFVVFPMAKAYEGFLKRYLLDLGLISKETFESRRFRIGRVLNPDVRPSHQDENWVYDDISQRCGPEIVRELWEAWLTCRNRVFHYFPKNTDRLTHEQAGRYIEQLFSVMQAAISCQNMDSRQNS